MKIINGLLGLTVNLIHKLMQCNKVIIIIILILKQWLYLTLYSVKFNYRFIYKVTIYLIGAMATHLSLNLIL